MGLEMILRNIRRSQNKSEVTLSEKKLNSDVERYKIWAAGRLDGLSLHIHPFLRFELLRLIVSLSAQ